MDRKEIIAELKAFGRGRKLPKGVTVRELINEGRRESLELPLSVSRSRKLPRLPV